MKKIIALCIVLILAGIPSYVCHAKFGLGLPSVIKGRVEKLDKKVREERGSEDPGETEIIKSWKLARPIEVDNDENATVPQIVIGQDGNAFAIWQQNDGTRNSIWGNKYVSGEWETSEQIDKSSQDAMSPQIAIGEDGNVIAVWSQSNGAQYDIWARRYEPNSGWRLEKQINVTGAGDAILPQIEIGEDNNAMVVWSQSDGVQYNILANRYETTGWQGVLSVEGMAGDANTPQIAIGEGGNAIVVWSHHTGSIQYDICVRRYVSSTSSWDALTTIDIVGGDAISPQIAMDQMGNAIVVWSQDNGTWYDVWANAYESGWQTAVKIENLDVGDADTPQVAMGQNGNAIVVWSQDDSNRHNIWANRYVVGSGWQTVAEMIETEDILPFGGDAYLPQIAMDQAGNAIVVWHQDDDKYNGVMYNIWSNRYILGFGWHTAERIEMHNAGDAGAAQIAIERNGNAIAVWSQNDGNTNNIWVNRYEQ